MLTPHAVKHLPVSPSNLPTPSDRPPGAWPFWAVRGLPVPALSLPASLATSASAWSAHPLALPKRVHHSQGNSTVMLKRSSSASALRRLRCSAAGSLRVRCSSPRGLGASTRSWGRLGSWSGRGWACSGRLRQPGGRAQTLERPRPACNKPWPSCRTRQLRLTPTPSPWQYAPAVRTLCSGRDTAVGTGWQALDDQMHKGLAALTYNPAPKHDDA